MSTTTFRTKLINVTINKAFTLIDYNTLNDIDKRYEFVRQTVFDDNSLTNDEKTEAIRKLNITYDQNKVYYNIGTRRTCENCNQECLATLPDVVIEWIPYNDLQDIKYLTKGGFSEIYTAIWNSGKYQKWDSKERRLIRLGRQPVILKRLENIESTNKRWFEEAESHLTISNKSPYIIQCYGLTQDPSNGDYMLVTHKMDLNLREYLQQNWVHLTWKKRIQFVYNIITALRHIHNEKAIHRDLHSGNILFKQINQRFFIGDLGFCGPINNPPKGIYGNLPYVAPEVIAGRGYTFKSDIYSIAMLMWEFSSGQPPFSNYEHDCCLVMKIIDGVRPRIVSGTPLEYQNLMKQCWDANPLERPNIDTLWAKIKEIYMSYQNGSNVSEANNNLEINNLEIYSHYASSRLSISKVHNFEGLSEPRNETEEEQKAFHNSRSYDILCIPDSFDDFSKK
ncbi:kinase-like domain-containing protein [Rhizophagus clarus]|uniref:Kinase-like domain-containing protein n=1 Tax=Rhizophagus clarus TaxID=94130 RepID=A0A8H3L4A7_9GLOM|nr:kinase-like domain-containing protein [Rhizophagus clarus]